MNELNGEYTSQFKSDYKLVLSLSRTGTQSVLDF